MAKIYGLFGAMTGKLADTVMSVRNGEQIGRKYQPVVFNPSTTAQVAQRAKMKLMSQLSAVMAPVIAIPRRGAVSSRNLFTKLNFPFTSYADDKANITLEAVQLTSSVVGFVEPRYTRGESAGQLFLANPVVGSDMGLSRVVYAIFAKGIDSKLRFAFSAVATSAGNDGTWAVQNTPLVNEEIVVYAYGVRDNNDNARAKFGNLTTVTAETVASLIVYSSLTESDITVTETRARTIAAVQG